MNKPHLTLSPAGAPVSSEPPVIVVVEISGTEFGIALSDVSSITLPLPPARYDNLPQGVAGMACLRGELFPVLAASEMLIPATAEKEAPANLVFDPCYAAPMRSADSARMLILSASGTQAALNVDQINAITPDVSSEQDGRLARSESVAGLLAAGCIERLTVVGPLAGGGFRSIALVNVEAFMEACCPAGGRVALRRTQLAYRGLLASEATLANWRSKRHHSGSNRRAA